MTLHLAFRVGTGEYVLPATEILHMESYEEAGTEVPGAPPWVEGLVQVRGRVVPLLDLRSRFGLPPPETEGRRSPRIIVVEHENRVVALLADSARDVLELDTTRFEPPPEIVRDGADGFIRSIAIHDNRMLMLLDLSRVLGEKSHSDEQR